MKINSISSGNNINYQKQNVKAQPQPYRNYVQIRFNQDDMEYGSIAGALASMAVVGMHLSKMNEKNLFKVAAISAPIIATVSCATMGIMSFAKIIKENRKNAQS